MDPYMTAPWEHAEEKRAYDVPDLGHFVIFRNKSVPGTKDWYIGTSLMIEGEGS